MERKEKGIKLLLLGVRGEVLRRLGERSPGLTGDLIWMGILLLLCCFLSLWLQRPTLVAVLQGRERVCLCIEHRLCLLACLRKVTGSHITSLPLLGTVIGVELGL